MNLKLTMKIKIDMKKTYKITLPKDAKVCAIDAKADDGVLNVTVKMEQKYMPKDGDIVYAQWDGDRSNYKWIFIYKESPTDPYEKCDIYAYLGIECDKKPISELHFDEYCTSQELLRPATEAEKQHLFDALAKHCKRWNAEKKCIEDLPRWRAKLNGNFYYINELCCLCTDADEYHSSHNEHYNIGNYFRTREAAEKVAEQIRDIFKNSKAE